MKKLIEKIKQIDVAYPRIAYVVVSIAWTIVGALPYFGYPTPFQDLKVVIILVLLIVLFIIISWFVLYLIKERKDNIDTTILEARKMLINCKYTEILTLRKTGDWSRSLWVEGRPYARYELGNIAKNAAINLQDDLTLASIYIDDLGWTLVSLKKYDEAKNYINAGLNLAKKTDDNYLVAKAKRHLAGIALEARDYSSARQLICDAEEFAKKIQNEVKRNEMLAGIYYALSMHFLKESKENKADHPLEKAEDYANKSENLRRNGDRTYAVKTYALKGVISEAKNDYVKAEEEYSRGLKLAKALGRNDETIRNLLGLARIAKKNGDIGAYKAHRKSAEKLLKKTPITFIIDENEMELIREEGD